VVGVHEVKARAPDLDVPDLQMDGTVAHLDRNKEACPVVAQGLANGDLLRLEAGVNRLLPNPAEK
jgi:hypothetical protein